MKEPTFENLLTVLPLSEDIKNLIKTKYLSFNSDQKSEVLYLLWDMYISYKSFVEAQLREKFQNKMAEEIFIPPEDFDTFIQKQVEQAISEKFYSEKESTELENIRKKIAHLIS